MVSFSCESCCDVLVKKKLDQHATRCHGAQFTCLDCSTTFEGMGYRQHTSCISEAQKYQKGLFRAEKGKGKGNGQNGQQGGNGRGNQRNGVGNGNGHGANPNLTPLGERVVERNDAVVEVEVKQLEERKVVEEAVIREKEKDIKPEKEERADKKRKREKKQKNNYKKDKHPKAGEMEKDATNGAAGAEGEEETLAQKFLDAISSKKETSISKVLKKLDKKGAEKEVWGLLKQAKVRKEEGGKVVLVLS
ncbi:hypothetical protein L211DRAFT_224411 [Terfezia boudieri ATCC MYA-4762]|uniref:Zinc finger C2H2 LYAR-type domain-containing protein n=1 Tax=Terfezia boudieri ATCC MYA-4762 TaxID=1051890 RepID=A0A3N4LQM8_9PEZI|nr:hypothetical protein L211DRAFT_224411 [Terfezia boudieri ATCC MYA-4762]